MWTAIRRWLIHLLGGHTLAEENAIVSKVVVEVYHAGVRSGLAMVRTILSEDTAHLERSVSEVLNESVGVPDSQIASADHQGVG